MHFIDVGQADSALVLCDGEAMLIDGGNVSDSSVLYSYLKKNGVKHLDYVVATHPHEDHLGGIPGALSYATAETVFCPVTEADSEPFASFKRAVEKQGREITVPTAGESFSLGCAQVEVLAPRDMTLDTNNISIVLRVVYGETAFLFTGDMEREEERDILDSGCKLLADVLKVGHHGSENSSTYPFLREVMPEYAVISVGEDNSYGHPTEEALSRLLNTGATVLRTDLLGDIVFGSDGKSVFLIDDEESITPSGAEEEIKFVLNENSKKFHHKTCASIETISEKNKETFSGERDELISSGYEPCSRCNP